MDGFGTQGVYDVLDDNTNRSAYDMNQDNGMTSKQGMTENIYADNTLGEGVEGTNNNGIDLNTREENLRKTETELLARQTQLDKLETEIKSNNVRNDNWPCGAYPITYHSILQEIPAFARGHMRRMYALVLVTFLALFWNFIVVMSLYLIDICGSTSLLFSVIFFGTGVFGAWKFWYRQIYYGLRDRKTLKWWVFFFFFFVHCLFGALLCIAPAEFPKGAAGFWLLTDAMQHNAVVGIFVLVNALLWLLLDVACWYYLVMSWRLYKTRNLEPVSSQLMLQNADI